MKVRVSNIQRFCLHDGPGIRTVVFLKGCNLRCPWCANPENIDYDFTEYYDEKTNEKRIIGYDIEALDLYDEIIKDKDYFRLNDGGITFSGGEPLLQIKKLEPLLKKLKDNDINIAIETNLQVSTELVEIALKYVSEFIIDIKVLDKKNNHDILLGDIDLYFKNVSLVSNKKPVVFRIPLSNEYTLTLENQNLIIDFLKNNPCEMVQIFKIHNLASSKYRAIGKEIMEFSHVDDEKVLNFYEKIKNIGVNVQIIKF
ncbi:MAG: 4Fe-4S cluster-binding domain-containing protein [Bacilli bacterium]|nr:4Fe-4S cluster-binding domain-containing protein [Bacilli bacterium]